MEFLTRRGKTTKILLAAATGLAVIAVSAFTGATVASASASSARVTSQIAGTTYGYVGLKTETAQTSYTSSGWVDLAGSTYSFQATSSTAVFARFSAQSLCNGNGAASNWCSVRILVICGNGSWQEAKPADGANFVWQWAGTWWGNVMIERAIPCVLFEKEPPARNTYNIKVQVKTATSSTSFVIQDWTLHAGVIS